MKHLIGPDSLIGWLYSKVADPKGVTLLCTIGYLILAYGGTTAILDRPRSIEGEIGTGAMYMLALFVAVGSLIAAPMCVIGLWHVEKWGTIMAGFGGTIYTGLIIILHATGDGNRQLQAAFVAAAVIALIIRAIHIWRKPVAPTREQLVRTQALDMTTRNS